MVGDLLRAGDRLEPPVLRAARRAAPCGGRPRSRRRSRGTRCASVLKQCGQLATIFVTPASFIVATFCSRVRLEGVLVAHPPGRVAGARLARPEDREVDARRLQQLRRRRARSCGHARRTTRRSRPSREPRAPASPGCEHAHVEALGPVRPLRLRLAPRVLRSARRRAASSRLGREAALDHDEVAAEVDDVVDVLDRDRALVDARAAGDAVPDDVVADRVRDERRSASKPSVAEQLRPLGEQLVAQAHDQELRRQLLARRVGRADVLAAAALGAGHRVDHLLPRHVGDRRRRRSRIALSSSTVKSSGSSRPRARVRPNQTLIAAVAMWRCFECGR